MIESYLVQRLKKPRPRRGTGAQVHHVFGGHALGLTKEQWDFVDEVFEIDYMGAAEYEFGAFHKAMGMLMQATERCAFGFVVDRKNIGPNVMRKFKGKEMPAPPTAPAVIYVVCQTSQREEIETRIRRWLADKKSAPVLRELRDSPGIHATLDPYSEWDTKVVGWLEIDNGFFFFLDKEMWRGVCGWFELEANDVEVVAKRSPRGRGRKSKKGVREARDHEAG